MNESKGFAVASLVIGVVALLTSCCYGGFLGIIGFVLGIIGLANKQETGLCVGGIITSIIAGIITIVSMFIGFSMLDSISEVGNTSVTTGTVNTEVSEDEDSGKADASESSEGEAKEEKITKGQFFVNDGLKVTVNDINTDFTEYDEWSTPEEGKKYIEVSFTYENNGDSDMYASIYDYDCYADNALCEQSYSFGGDFINTNLSKGRNVSFSTYYVVPIDANTIELEYTANIWTGEKVVIEVK